MNPNRYAAAACGYAVLTAAIFHNLLPVITTNIYSSLGDPLLNTSILAWNARHVPLTAAWWNYPAFAPLTGVTAFTEHLLGAYPLTTPIVWMTGNPGIAYGVLLMTCFVANGVAMFALVRELTRSDTGAFVAGLAFAFAPYQASAVTHVQMLMAFGMPLALLGLHQYVENGRHAGLGWFTAGWLAVVLSNAYFLVFFPALAALWCVWFARGRWMRLLPVAIAAAAVVMATAPLLWGYHVRQAAYDFSRSYDEIRSFGADVSSVLNVTHQEMVWHRVLNTTAIETSLFPGVAILILAVAGVVPRLRGAWRRRDRIVFYATAALAMWLLALGPEPAWHGRTLTPYGPYHLLLLLPGGNSIRVPARAFELTVLCLAVAAGAGAAMLFERRKWRWLGAALAAAVVVEGWFLDVTARAPEPLPAGTIPAGALVMDTPLGASIDNVPAEYLAVVSGYRVINGFSGYAPSYFASLREAMAQHRDEAFAMFRKDEDLYVIIRPIVDAPFIRFLESQRGVEMIAVSTDVRVYRLPRLDHATGASVPRPFSHAT